MLLDHAQRFETLRKKNLEQQQTYKSTAESTIHRSHWVLGISPKERALPDQMGPRPYRTTGPKKSVLVNRIIRAVWGVEDEAEIGAIGQCELRLDEHQLSVLLANDNAIVKDIAQARDANIEVFKSLGKLRITANKPTCEVAVEDIRRELSQVYIMTFSLDPFQDLPKRRSSTHLFEELFDPEEVTDVENITRTTIKRGDKTPSEVVVRAKARRDAEDARRLMVSLLDLPDTKYSLLTAKTALGARAHLRDAGSRDDLPYRLRRKHLSRCVLPACRLSEVSSNEKNPGVSEQATNLEATSIGEETLQGNRTRGPKSTKDQAESDSREHAKRFLGPLTNSYLPKHYPNFESLSRTFSTDIVAREDTYRAVVNSQLALHWKEAPDVVITATCGQILHDAESHPSRLVPIEPNKWSDHQRTFCATAPGFRQLMSAVEPHGEIDESLVVRLVPSPFNALVKNKKLQFPELELEVVLSGADAGAIRDVQLRAILDHRNVDVMLPDQCVDLQFTRKDFLRYGNENEEKEVVEFVQAIQETMAGSEAIRAPAMLHLRIPRQLIRFPVEASPESTSSEEGPMHIGPSDNFNDSSTISNSTAQNHEEQEESYKITYFHLSLEHRQSATFHLNNTQLIYSTAEAGRIGGRRSELQLEYRAAPLDHRPTKGKTSFWKFVDNAFDMVGYLNEGVLGKLPLNFRMFDGSRIGRDGLQPAPAATGAAGRSAPRGKQSTHVESLRSSIMMRPVPGIGLGAGREAAEEEGVVTADEQNRSSSSPSSSSPRRDDDEETESLEDILSQSSEAIKQQENESKAAALGSS